MTKRTWHNGPPPHVGWWNAAISSDPSCWRWWNGVEWSAPVFHNVGKFLAHGVAITREGTDFQHLIRWTDYYPKNARVPRIDPRKEKV